MAYVITQTDLSLLAVGDLDIAPASVDHVPLGEHAHLGLVAREADEPKPLRLSGLDILLHLGSGITRSSIQRKESSAKRFFQKISRNFLKHYLHKPRDSLN